MALLYIMVSLVLALVVISKCTSEDAVDVRDKQSSLQIPSPASISLNPLVNSSPSNIENANKILSKYGLEAGIWYEYHTFLSIKKSFHIGEGGTWDFLKCSVEHDPTIPGDIYRADSIARAQHEQWELFYYTNINQTWLVEYKKPFDASSYSARIIRAKMGRWPDLNTAVDY